MSRSKLAWVGLSLSWVLLVGFRLAARPASPHPLRQTELLALVAGQSLPETIALQIKTRGLDFRPDDAYRALLTTAGADPLILRALDGAKTVPTGSANSASAATTEPAALQHLANAGKSIHEKKVDDAKKELDYFVGRRSKRLSPVSPWACCCASRRTSPEPSMLISKSCVRIPTFRKRIL